MIYTHVNKLKVRDVFLNFCNFWALNAEYVIQCKIKLPYSEELAFSSKNRFARSFKSHQWKKDTWEIIQELTNFWLAVKSCNSAENFSQISACNFQYGYPFCY